MPRSASLLALLSLVLLSACASTPTEYKVLRYSAYSYPYPQPLKLYVAPERDRSGSDYATKIQAWELNGFQKRIREGLFAHRLHLDTYTAVGNPTTLKLRNPFTIVADSSEADLLLNLRVDGFEEATVEVTSDRMVFWNTYGIPVQVYATLQRVPRMLVALDAQLRERGQAAPFYGFQAQGVSVNRPTRR